MIIFRNRSLGSARLSHPFATDRIARPPFTMPSRHVLGLLLFLWILLQTIPAHGQEAMQALIDHAIQQSGQANTFDPESFQKDLKHLPIGVFDSGLGGLTVLEALLTLDAFNNDTLAPGKDGRLDFEKERFIYYGDQANMPYGNYGSVGKTDFLRELILKDAIFLLGKRHRLDRSTAAREDKLPVKAIVIACNTATAYGLDDLRNAIAKWKLPVPVIGVVEAGAESLRDQPNLRPDSTVAVLATVGTCNAQAYPKAISKVLGLAGKRLPNVIQQGSVGIAGAIEGDPAFVWTGDLQRRPEPYRGPTTTNVPNTSLHAWNLNPRGLIPGQQANQINSVENYVRFDVGSLVESYRLSGDPRPIESVVLGCTHFPLVEQEILEAFAQLRNLKDEKGNAPYEKIIGKSIQVVNPAVDTAKALFRSLAKSQLRLKGEERSSQMGDRFYMSVPNLQLSGIPCTADGSGLEYDYKYGRSTGNFEREDTIPIGIDQSSLPNSAKALVEKRLPNVWERMKPLHPSASDQGQSQPQSPPKDAYEWTFPVMGTTLTLQAYANDPTKLEEVFKGAKDRIEQYVAILSDYREESEVSQWGLPDKVGQWQSVSDVAWEVLIASERWNQLSDGMFDPSIGRLTQLWRKSRRAKSLPSPNEVQAALRESGWKSLELNHARKQLRVNVSNVKLDFGAIAKGWIVEQAFQYLKEQGFSQSLVRSGGDMRCGDPPPGKEGWRIEIGRVSDQEVPDTMLLNNKAIASSGDMFQYLEVDGKRYSHVIDPKSGLGIEGPRMATVVANNSTDADACATTMCILGHTAGMELAKRLENIEVRIVSLEPQESHSNAPSKPIVRVSTSPQFPIQRRSP